MQNPESEPISEPSGENNKFGDSEKIIEAMKDGEVIEDKGIIDELFPETVPAHQNIVDVVDIGAENANEILTVAVRTAEGNVIPCVFKPLNGENGDVKKENGIEDIEFYPRECAAYVVDNHFGFDLVPPTVIREVEGKGIGALQLFLNHDKHINLKRADDETWNSVKSSEDWGKIAVLDWILANCERHNNNVMFQKDDPGVLCAIDHGICLNSHVYFQWTIKGASLQLTMDTETEKAKKVEAPAALVEKVKDGIERQAELEAKLSDLGLKDYEIKAMW